MLRWPFGRQRHLAPQAAYALWARTYAPRPHNALMSLEQRTVLSLLPGVKGLRVLDAGCGSGRYLRELCELGANPIGIDLSAAMLERASGISARVARGDICALPIDSAAIDLVVCGLVLGDVPHLDVALVEISRVLRPGGSVVYSVVHPIGSVKGWTRSFDAGGRRVIIDGYWHSAEQHRLACRAAGLRITAWEEPALAAAPEQPAALVVRASK